MFASNKETPLDAQNIVNRHFKPLLKRAGLPNIRWHDLRHTYATLLLARGTHPTYVQKSLGHASVQLTLDRYSHWMPSMGRATASAMDDALADKLTWQVRLVVANRDTYGRGAVGYPCVVVGIEVVDRRRLGRVSFRFYRLALLLATGRAGSISTLLLP